MIEVVGLLAAEEGFLLGPIYSGKAMAGLIDLVRKGRLARDENIVFIHTRDAVTLFAYQNQFSRRNAG